MNKSLLSIGAILLFILFSSGHSDGQATSNPTDEGATSSSQSASSQQAAAPSASTSSRESFIIGNDDLLAISVWKEPDLTKQIPVRSDGKISLPLIGEIQAAGRTPSELQKDIADKLKGYMTDPQVSVIVQEIRSQKFNILGQVTKPGSYPLTAEMKIVDAIAIAGGLRDFAKKKGIYLLRPNSSGEDSRYLFNYQDFIKGKHTEQNIALKPRDTIIVP